MQPPTGSLLAALADLPDPRGSRGKRHPLAAMLTLACVALCCGQQTYGAIADWGRKYAAAQPGWAAMLGFTRDDLPCGATFFLLFRALDRQAFEGLVAQWAEAVLATHPPADGTPEAIALDGKTLRGSAKHGVPAAHLLSAFSHRLGVTLGQQPVADKTNEIPVAPAVISQLAVAGRVLTMDALLTQRAIAQAITDSGGDYVMVVKENQPRLHQEIATLLGTPPPRPIPLGARRRPRTAATDGSSDGSSP
jgi:hypothetical protein